LEAHVSRRLQQVLYTAALLCALHPTSAALSYPTKPVSIITAGSPGTGPDVMARVIADGFTRAWGHQVVVINRPGAAGFLSVQTAASALSDGHTLYLGFASAFVSLPEAQPKIAPHLQRLIPIGLVAEQPMIFAVSPKLGVNSLAELLNQARERPGEMLYGGFRATMPHLAGAMLVSRSEADLRFIPSMGPRGIQDVLEGSLHVAIEGMGAVAGLIQSGLLKPLAVAGRTRLPDYPDIPTVSEAVPSLREFEARGWVALFAPLGTPHEIVSKANADLRSMLSDPEVARKLTAQGAYPRPILPEETAAFIKQEQDLWRPIVRQLDLVSQ